MKNKYILQIETESERLIEFLFLDCAEQLDKFGGTLIPKNKETNELLMKNTELKKYTKDYLRKNFK